MMNKRGMTWALVIALTAAVPAFGIFGIPSPDELLIWLVLRPMMHGNQRAMIANQLLELQKLVEQLQTAQQDLVAWIIPKDALSSCFSTQGIT